MTGALATATATATATEPAEEVDWDADQAVTALYYANYRSLVRLAVLLVRDVASAEEVVQDAFVAMHNAWRRLRDPEKALAYLRQSVVNRARSVLRHRAVVEKYAPKGLPDAPSAEQGAVTELERSAVIRALGELPARQREALVLRYYADLSVAEIASTMGISRGAVRSHTARNGRSAKCPGGIVLRDMLDDNEFRTFDDHLSQFGGGHRADQHGRGPQRLGKLVVRGAIGEKVVAYAHQHPVRAAGTPGR